MMRHASFFALMVGVAFGLTLLSGCTAAPGPQDRVWMPACILLCEAAVEEASATGGDASTGSISQGEQFGGGGQVQ